MSVRFIISHDKKEKKRKFNDLFQCEIWYLQSTVFQTLCVCPNLFNDTVNYNFLWN